MVRQGPVVSRRVVLALALGLILPLLGVTPAPAQGPGPGPAPEPIDRLPYRVRVFLATDPDARVDAARRSALVDGWMTLVRRFVGAPWQVAVAPESEAAPLVLGGELEQLDPAPLASLSASLDKLWLVRVSSAGSGLVFTGREYDAATRRLGPLQRRDAPLARDTARVFFQFSLDLFAPYAIVGEKFGKDVNLVVRGASIEAASPVGRVVAPGTIFQPFRVVPRKDGPVLVREIPYTFLRAEAAEGNGARCSFVSVYSDPFTGRVIQKTTLIALGIKPGQSPTRLRFQTLPDRAPAAGYVVTARVLPDGSTRELGLTDREGRLVLPAGFADGLVVIRLLAGSSEPMIEFPLIPGEETAERVVPAFDPLALTVTLETRLDSLRDTIVDLVAVRARLLARLKARFDGEDWPEAQASLDEYAKLPPRETFAAELKRLGDDAARQQMQSKRPVLTKTAQARLTDLQSLLDRYLDDEEFKAYADALDKIKTEPAAAKAAAKPKATAPAAKPAEALPRPAPAPPAAPTTAPAPAPAPTPGAAAKPAPPRFPSPASGVPPP